MPKMIHANNCEKLPKFVKVTAKILSVPFFRTRCTCNIHCRKIGLDD